MKTAVIRQLWALCRDWLDSLEPRQRPRGVIAGPMRSQLVQRAIDHRHADRLAAALALPENLDWGRGLTSRR